MPSLPDTVGRMVKSRAVGAWALVSAVVAPVWLFGGLYAVLFGRSSEASPVVSVIANVAAFGWFVVPIAAIAAVVLAIIAILQRRGRGFGIAALVVLLVVGGLVVAFVVAAFGGLPL